MIFPLQLQTIHIKHKKVELFVPDPAVVQQEYESGRIPFPYWSQIWPSSLAMAEFIIGNNHLIKGKNLLELGAGLGLPSLVSCYYATSVICSDKEQDAVEIISRSVIHNGNNNLKATVINWDNLPELTDINIVLLSDINYEPVAFEKLKDIILSFIERGITILLATPQRLMAKTFIEQLLDYCIQQEEITVLHKNVNVPISILVVGNCE